MKPNEVEFIPAEEIEVLPWVERTPREQADRELETSIRKGGIQQPLVVVRHKGHCLLVKGSRRLRIGKRLGLARFRCVVDAIPKGMDPEAYISDVRLALAEHRQGLPPSVEAGFLKSLKEQFGFNHVQLSRYRGVDPDTITKYMAINDYIQPVKDALDSYALTMDAASVLNGMTVLGQDMIWKKHARHLLAGKISPDEILRMYRPNIHPAWYTDPEAAEQRLERPTRAKKRKGRVTYTGDELKRKLASLDVKQLIFEEFQAELAELIERRKKATPKVRELLKSPKAKVARSLMTEREMEYSKQFYSLYCE
jgi:ParB/RepB/Spo0J family partition protein